MNAIVTDCTPFAFEQERAPLDIDRDCGPLAIADAPLGACVRREGQPESFPPIVGVIDGGEPQRPECKIIPRATVESIVKARNNTLRLYTFAHEQLEIASLAVFDARKAGLALRHRETSINYHIDAEKCAFHFALKIPERVDYETTARRIVDTDVWSHIVEMTELERLMDKTAKTELHKQLLDSPPEVTVDNVYATLERFITDADMIFKRGIATCFSKLDRRFKSHDGFKIGSRLILDRMFDDFGSLNYHRDMESTLLDIERTFLVLDGRTVPAAWVGIVGKLRNHRQIGHGARQGEVEDEFFTVRVFKNGNCHVWFKRDDLLERVNKLLAEYYGAAVGDAQQTEEDVLHNPKTALAKNYGFFETPDEACDHVMGRVHLSREMGTPPFRILEPSAGTGQLARRCLAYDPGAQPRAGMARDRNIVDCVEIHPERALALRASKLYNHVYACDFLALNLLKGAELYDIVVMNPPFDRERDIDHVMHALEFLKPDGYLVAVMSAGTEFRETRKTIAFRALMTKMGARFRDLPERSFASVGTNCNTVLLKVYKSGKNFWD